MKLMGTCCLLLSLCCTTLADDAKPLSTDAAAKKVNEKVTVEMEVKSTGESRQGLVFLNSMANFRDGKNFTIVIQKEAWEKLKKAGVANPKEHFRNKTIRVTGTVTEYMNRPQIEVTEPEQIKLVEKK